MNANVLALIIHAVVGLAVIACAAVLGAIGTITGQDALGLIGVVTSFLLGSGAATIGTLSNTSVPPTS